VPNFNGFLKENRIQQTADFQLIRQRGRRIRNQYFIVNYHNKSNDYPRLGTIISKRHAAKAVQRNRIRRQIKEWFRSQKSTLLSYDYVIIATPQTQKLPQPELRQCLNTLLQKLNSHCKNCS